MRHSNIGHIMSHVETAIELQWISILYTVYSKRGIIELEINNKNCIWKRMVETLTRKYHE